MPLKIPETIREISEKLFQVFLLQFFLVSSCFPLGRQLQPLKMGFSFVFPSRSGRKRLNRFKTFNAVLQTFWITYVVFHKRSVEVIRLKPYLISHTFSLHGMNYFGSIQSFLSVLIYKFVVEIGKKDSSRITDIASMSCCFRHLKGKAMQCQKNEEDRHSIYARR